MKRRLATLLLVLAACAYSVPRKAPGAEVWEVWFEPTLDLDITQTLEYLAGFYDGLNIAFVERAHPPEVCPSVSFDAPTSIICVYDDVREYVGAALLDPGNHRQETDCGDLPGGVRLGVMAGALQRHPGAEYYVAVVLAHEIGHGLGLGHVDPPEPSSIMTPVLYTQGSKSFGAVSWAYLEIVLGRVED